MTSLGNKEIMSKNLKHYIKVSGKKRAVICADLGFPYSTFTEWVNGKKYPRIDNIEKLANYFGIEKSNLIEAKGASNEIGNKLKSLRIQKNISLMELASELHIDTMILKQYEEGIKKIPQELLEKFASYFDTTIDNLIGLDLEARRKHVVITNDDVLKERYEKWKKEVGYNQFNDEEVEQLIEIAQMMQTMNQDEIKQTIKYMKFLISQR